MHWQLSTKEEKSWPCSHSAFIPLLGCSCPPLYRTCPEAVQVYTGSFFKLQHTGRRYESNKEFSAAQKLSCVISLSSKTKSGTKENKNNQGWSCNASREGKKSLCPLSQAQVKNYINQKEYLAPCTVPHWHQQLRFNQKASTGRAWHLDGTFF